jgi:hypothetical protein
MSSSSSNGIIYQFEWHQSSFSALTILKKGSLKADLGEEEDIGIFM